MSKIQKFFSDWTMFEKMWLGLSIIIMISLSLAWGDSPVALVSGITGMISVVLCAKGKILNYAFGLIQATTYAYICYQTSIYGEFMYNILMIPMIIIGIISWKKNMGEEEVKARNLSVRGLILLVVSIVVSTLLYSGFLKILGGAFALVDSTSTVISIIATILMITRYSEQWILWIIVNIVSVLLWFMALQSGSNGGITMLVMWTAYLFNSIYGWWNWRKMANESK